jgi:hypothetical protein
MWVILINLICQLSCETHLAQIQQVIQKAGNSAQAPVRALNARAKVFVVCGNTLNG